MPRFCSSAPRKKLPPPITTATCMPRAHARSRSAGPSPARRRDRRRSRRRRTPRRRASAPPARTAGLLVIRASVALTRVCLPSVIVGSRRAKRGGRGAVTDTGDLLASSIAPGQAWPTSNRTNRVDGQAGLGQHLLDRLLLVLHRRLLEQDEVLEEGVDAAFDDPRTGQPRACPPPSPSARRRDARSRPRRPAPRRGSGTSGASRRSACRRRARRRATPRPSPCRCTRPSRRPAAAGPAPCGACRPRPGRRATRDPVDDELLADLGGLLLDRSGDGTAVRQRRSEERVDVGRLGRGDLVDQLLRERDEVSVLRDEVGLAVELEQRVALCARRDRSRRPGRPACRRPSRP